MSEYKFTAKWPMVRNPAIRSPFKICRFSIGEFGGSRTNHKWTLFVFGWAVCNWHRDEYHDRSDAERADQYWKRWHECEQELHSAKLERAQATIKRLKEAGENLYNTGLFLHDGEAEKSWREAVEGEE